MNSTHTTSSDVDSVDSDYNSDSVDSADSIDSVNSDDQVFEFITGNVKFVVKNDNVVADADNNTIFVDPAGSAFYSNYDNAKWYGGGVSGILYNYTDVAGDNLKNTFTEDEFNDVKMLKRAIYKKYNNCGVIHVISTDFGDDIFTIDQIKQCLEKSYERVYDEFVKNFDPNTNEFRMIVLSGGIYSGDYKNTILQLTPEILANIFGKYTTADITIYIYEFNKNSYDKLIDSFLNFF